MMTTSARMALRMACSMMLFSPVSGFDRLAAIVAVEAGIFPIDFDRRDLPSIAVFSTC